MSIVCYILFIPVRPAVNICTYIYMHTFTPKSQLLNIYQHLTVEGAGMGKEQLQHRFGVTKLQWIMSGLELDSPRTS